jgi:16S rRNA (adenine1518-N6/adenine1519-N6)-dimethyltransferase
MPVVSRQRLGQHFLADAGWRARIASTLRAGPDDVWLEIGAGHGEMTAELARRAGRVVAIEVDPRLLERLRQLARELPNIEVVGGDVLELDLARLTGPRRFKVYGNLPYYITSPILHRLFEWADRLEAIHVVVQLEVAARLAARPARRQYGYLSVLTQLYSRPEIVLRIPPGAFRPRPRVTSALVALHLPGERAHLDIADEGQFLEFVKACFAHKRKTLLNNLRPLLGDERAQGALRALGLPADARAEQLSVTQFANLFRQLFTARPAGSQKILRGGRRPSGRGNRS